MQELTGKLENWIVGRTSQSGEEYIIWANIYEDIHKRFPDGLEIHTSGIKLTDYPIDDLKEGMVIKTRNSTYLLGKKH